MKKILVVSCCIIVIAIIVLFSVGLSKNTRYFKGVLVENDISENVEIIVETRNIDKLLYTIKGDVIVIGDLREHSYFFTGQLFPMEGYDYEFYAAAVHPELSVLGNPGYLFFDKEFTNIAIITNYEKIYAGDEEFLQVVERADWTKRTRTSDE